MPNETLILSRSDIEQVLTSKDLFRIVESSLKEMAKGTVAFSQKSVLSLKEARTRAERGYLIALSAYVKSMNIGGVKWVTGIWNNANIGLPSLMATMILNDTSTGFPVSFLEATLIN